MDFVTNIFVDLLNNKLVSGLSDKSQWQFPTQFQGSQLPLRVYPLLPIVPQPIRGQFYTQVPIDTMTLRIAVGPSPGTQALLADQSTWSKQLAADADGLLGYFYATLDFNTSEMNTAIGTSDTYPTKIEIVMSDGGAMRPVFQGPLTMQSVVIGPSGGGALPTPAAQYTTTAELMAILSGFVKFNGNPDGSTIILGNGSYNRIIGCNPDGSRLDTVE